MRARIPTIQAVHDGAAEPLLLPRLGRRLQRIIVPVEPVHVRDLGGGAQGVDGVGGAPPRRGEVDGLGARGAAPAALADEEGAADDGGVDFVGGAVEDGLLGFQDGGFAFVVAAEDFGVEVEGAGGGGDGQGLVEGHFALAVDHTARVEAREVVDIGGGGAGLAGVEGDDVGGGLLEREEDGVGGEGLEVGMEFLVKV